MLTKIFEFIELLQYFKNTTPRGDIEIKVDVCD